MCGRYYIDEGALPEELARVLNAIARSRGGEPVRTGEMFPSQSVPVLAGHSAGLMRWGFAGARGRVINARCETAPERAMFRDLTAAQRCLIPASGYYEWQHDARGRAGAQRYALFRARQPLYLAGLWRREPGQEQAEFVILTRAAAPGVSGIHARMPVILPRDACRAWLDGAPYEEMMARALDDIAFRPVEN